MNLLHLSSLDLAEMCRTILETGIGVLLQSTVILLIGGMAGALLRRHGPALQCALYKAALFGTLVCGLLSLCLGSRLPSRWSLALPAASRTTAITWAKPGQADTTTSAVSGPAAVAPQAGPEKLRDAQGKAVRVTVLPNYTASFSASAPATSPDLFPYFEPSQRPVQPNGMGWLYIGLVGVWLSGTALQGTWLLFCYLGVWRLRQRCLLLAEGETHALLQALCTVRRVPPPMLLLCAEVRNVFLTGLRRPAILLPATYRQDFSPSALRAILIHEVTHLTRKDTAWTLGTRLLCAMGWVQPLLWVLCRQWEQASEEVCDLAVLEQETSPHTYADCLLRLAERLTPTRQEQVVGTGIIAFRSSLGRRVQRLLAHSSASSASLSARARLAVVSGVAGIVALAALIVPVSAQSGDDAWSNNARLEQRVKITAEGVPLGDLMSLLSQKTGVQLAANRTVRDEKIVVFGPARPLKSLLSDIAALENAVWIHDRDSQGKDHYELGRDIKAQQYEEQLHHANEERFLAQLDAQVKALEETPEELAKRPGSDPIRIALNTLDVRGATSIYGLLTQEQKEQLLQQGQVSLPVSELNAKQKDAIEGLFHGARFDALNNRPEIRQGIMAPIAQIPRDQMDKEQVTLDVLDWSGNQQVYVTGPTGFNMLVMDLHANAKFVLPPHGNPYSGARCGPEESLPDPKVVRSIAGNIGTDWLDRLQALAEQTGQPVMADFYRSKPLRIAAEGDEAIAPETPLGVLDAFCRPQGYLWWNRGKTLLLRKRDWYDQRLYEVPDRWVLELTQRLKSHNGKPTRADMLRLQELSTDQIIGLVESAGGSADKRLLIGLHEAMEAMAAAPGDKDAPPYPGVISPDNPGPSVITPDIADPHQRALLADYGRLEKVPADELASGKFGFIMLPNERTVPDGATKINVGIETYYPLAKSIHAGYLLTVPLTLPEDHRDKTQIEVGP
jgi:beta-lactamase regulating signal transducer with metallopeptidase domain